MSIANNFEISTKRPVGRPRKVKIEGIKQRGRPRKYTGKSDPELIKKNKTHIPCNKCGLFILPHAKWNHQQSRICKLYATIKDLESK